MDPAWDEYRRRQRGFWLAIPLALLWVVPGSLITRFIVRHSGFDDQHVRFWVVIIPMMAFIVCAHLRRVFWRCPNCGRFFQVCWWYGNPNARRCVHCGLPRLDSKKEPAERELA
jgi:hypothetical protein